MLLELLNNNVLQSACFHGTAVLIQTADVGLLWLKLVNMDYKNIIFAFIKHDNIIILENKMESQLPH